MHPPSREMQQPSAMSGIPWEILSLIFVHCLGWDPLTRPRLNAGEAPLVLCNVCSTWRAIALQTPALWSCFQLTFVAGHFNTDLLALVDLWLRRSGAHPLSFGLSYDATTALRHSKELNQLIQLLVRHSAQWLIVELQLPDVDQFHLFRGDFPALESLAIGCTARVAEVQITTFTNAPNLCAVQLNNRCSADAVVLPWSQLSTVKCEALTVKECLNLLLKTKNICQLTALLRTGEWVPATTRGLALPALHALHLLREDGHMDLLDHLLVPRLETLSVSLRAGDMHRFGQFLARSGCTLVRVLLDAWTLDARALLQCFASLACVQELTLWRPPRCDDAFLQKLADHRVLPNLQVLNLNHTTPVDFSMQGLVALLAARWKAPVQLWLFRGLLHKESCAISGSARFGIHVLRALGMRIEMAFWETDVSSVVESSSGMNG